MQTLWYTFRRTRFLGGLNIVSRLVISGMSPNSRLCKIFSMDVYATSYLIQFTNHLLGYSFLNVNILPTTVKVK
jgi:hypothetical protein